MKNQKGFSLVELLVVVIIIAIIAAIAIPNLLSSRRNANQASAKANLRTIHSAEITYFAANGTYGDFAALAATANGDLIDDSFTATSVVKNTFTYTLTTGTNIYCAMAISSDTAALDYGVDEQGVLFEGVGPATCSGGDLGGVTTVVGSN